ncbi:hypothetical protein M0R88_09380 [Halorussus gelatinilyticus]|uniref:Uncharacterized protein n=1 Tax=Halorussus gelatinilyticus TaxID=2937524 RepID=A0A8U0IQC5_9EURY|nr:hypothetical protein [Halorussus gelatinilyticus]UPW02284.1 hypothetical protein M0R88_09380 [Halorussus gelatinilyticus]
MRRLLVGLFVVSLVVGAVPASAATYPDAGTACAQTSGGEVLIGVLPGASNPTSQQVLTGETSLYPGTTFQVALCKGGEVKPTRGPEWKLENPEGLEVLNRTDATVTVRVTGEKSRVDLPGLVSGKQNLAGVSVVVQQSPTVESKLANGSITFENASAADAYRKAEQRYLASLSNLENATARLNESATALESGGGDSAALNETVVTAVNESRSAVATRGEALETRLYETAWRSDGRTAALSALDAAQRRERRTDAEAERAMTRYHSALETAASDAKTTVLLNLGGAALLGLVAGALPGWKLTASRLEDIRYDRQVNSDVSYGLGVLVRAVGLAVLTLALTVGGLVALGGLSTLGGLL